MVNGILNFIAAHFEYLLKELTISVQDILNYNNANRSEFTANCKLYAEVSINIVLYTSDVRFSPASRSPKFYLVLDRYRYVNLTSEAYSNGKRVYDNLTTVAAVGKSPRSLC